jgi:hypothetical protein
MQMVAEVAAENNITTGGERLLMNESLTARRGPTHDGWTPPVHTGRALCRPTGVLRLLCFHSRQKFVNLGSGLLRLSPFRKSWRKLLIFSETMNR